jgi:hypothetical protein
MPTGTVPLKPATCAQIAQGFRTFVHFSTYHNFFHVNALNLVICCTVFLV